MHSVYLALSEISQTEYLSVKIRKEILKVGCRQNVDPPFWTPFLDPLSGPPSGPPSGPLSGPGKKGGKGSKITK